MNEPCSVVLVAVSFRIGWRREAAAGSVFRVPPHFGVACCRFPLLSEEVIVPMLFTSRTTTVRSFVSALLTTKPALTLLAFVAAVMASPVMAWAQDENAPPQPVLRQSPPQWLGFGIMFVLLLVVTFISLMPSKRSHQG